MGRDCLERHPLTNCHGPPGNSWKVRASWPASHQLPFVNHELGLCPGPCPSLEAGIWHPTAVCGVLPCQVTSGFFQGVFPGRCPWGVALQREPEWPVYRLQLYRRQTGTAPLPPPQAIRASDQLLPSESFQGWEWGVSASEPSGGLHDKVGI